MSTWNSFSSRSTPVIPNFTCYMVCQTFQWLRFLVHGTLTYESNHSITEFFRILSIEPVVGQANKLYA